MHIVFLNREPAKQLKDKPRRVTNAKEIISALVAAFAGRDQILDFIASNLQKMLVDSQGA